MPDQAVIYTALARYFTKKADECRPQLKAGEHRVEARVSVNLLGVLEVKEDSEYTPTTSIPYKAAFALFLRYAGMTGPSAMKALIRALTEASQIGRINNKEAREARIAAIREVADLDEAERLVQTSLGTLPKSKRNGAVHSKVSAGVRIAALVDD